METEMNSKLICQVCGKEFSCTSTRNRHIRNFHTEVEQPIKKKRIMCPVCPNENVFSYHFNLLEHLTDNHRVQISEKVLYFRNMKEFATWRGIENIDKHYACSIKRKNPTGEEEILYNCNRSDSRGFVSVCKKRRMKTGGSIRIRGMCPSRINAKISRDGNVRVKFTETHVGHDSKFLSKKRPKNEENPIVGQSTPGITDIIHINQRSPERTM